MNEHDTIFNAALALPEHERAELAHRLLESLGEKSQEDVDAAWVEEAQRRLEAYTRGEIKAIDGEPILRALQAGQRP